MLVIDIIPLFFHFQSISYDIIPHGILSHKQYLSTVIGYTNAALWANENLPENAKILIDNTFCLSSYLKRKYYVTSLFDKYWYEVFANEESTPEDIYKTLKQNGITHIFYTMKMSYVMHEYNVYRNSITSRILLHNLSLFQQKYLKQEYVSPLPNNSQNMAMKITQTAVYSLK